MFSLTYLTETNLTLKILQITKISKIEAEKVKKQTKWETIWNRLYRGDKMFRGLTRKPITTDNILVATKKTRDTAHVKWTGRKVPYRCRANRLEYNVMRTEGLQQKQAIDQNSYGNSTWKRNLKLSSRDKWCEHEPHYANS